MSETISTTHPPRYNLHDADPAVLLQWWHSLDKNRGARARLRRVDRPDDALLTDSFALFLSQMPPRWAKPYHLYASAMVASILAQVTHHQQGGQSFAAQLGAGNNQPIMSELRFQQLIQSRTAEEFFRRLLRAVQLLDRSTNILSLTEGILQWYDEHIGGLDRNPINRLGVKWARDYYLPGKNHTTTAVSTA